MIIKIWNNYDRGVYKITPKLRKWWKREGKNLFSPEERKQLRQISKELCEQTGLVFVHNLKRGWENKLLAVGEVLNKAGQKLNSREDIFKSLSADGEIQFHYCRKNGSVGFINKNIKKTDNLCWD